MGINCSEPVVLSTGRTCALAGFLPCGCSSGPFPEVFPFPLLACSLASALTTSSDRAVQPVCSTRVCFSTSCFTVILFQDVSPYPCLSFLCLRMRAESLQSCLTLCNPMDCSLPGSSIHGFLQARILEHVAMPFSRGSSQPRDRTQISYVCLGRWVLYH